MSGFSQFPSPSARYTVADSFDMPTNPSVGTLVWQADMQRLVVWTGDFWAEAGDRREDEVLFHDYPISGAVWDDFTFTANNEVLGGSAAIVTRIEAYALTGGTTLLTMTTYDTGYADRVPLVMNLEWPGLTTVTIDLWLPTDNLQVGSVLDAISSSEPLLSGSDFSITVLGRWL